VKLPSQQQGQSSIETLKSLISSGSGKLREPKVAPQRNRGVTSRAARDEQQMIDQPQQRKPCADEERVTAALTAKALLYDQLKAGNAALAHIQSSDHLLIDVDQRRKQDEQLLSEHTTGALVEIEDEYGRERTVEHGSRLHLEHLQRLCFGASAFTGSGSSSGGNGGGEGGGQWAWSKGHRPRDEEPSGDGNRAFGQLVQQRIDEEVAARKLQLQSAKDKSMLAPWESVLTSSARPFLEEVHSETARARALAGKGEAVSEVEIDGGALVFPEGEGGTKY